MVDKGRSFIHWPPYIECRATTLLIPSLNSDCLGWHCRNEWPVVNPVWHNKTQYYKFELIKFITSSVLIIPVLCASQSVIQICRLFGDAFKSFIDVTHKWGENSSKATDTQSKSWNRFLAPISLRPSKQAQDHRHCWSNLWFTVTVHSGYGLESDNFKSWFKIRCNDFWLWSEIEPFMILCLSVWKSSILQCCFDNSACNWH